MAKKKMIQRNSLTALLIIGVLVICAPIAFAGWLRLEVHPQVNLGTINAQSFNVEYLSFNPLKSTTNEVSIRLSSGRKGLTGVLCVKLVSASSGVDTERFKWRGGHQDTYIPATDRWVEVARVCGAAWRRTFTMSYRYQPSEDDRPDKNYWVRLRFRLRLYYDYDGVRCREQTIQKTVRLNWSTDPWIILHIPNMAVDLGTIDAGLYDPGTDTWTPLTSGRKSVWVIAFFTGFTLTVTAESTGAMPADLTRFQMIGGLLGTFTSLNVPPPGLILATSATGTRLWITNIRYQYVPCWEDAPGAYRVTVTYTVTAN